MRFCLSSERLKLRSLELDRDRDALYEWENDAEAWGSSGTLNPISYDFIDRFITISSASIIEKQSLALAIEVKCRSLVGYVQLFDYDAVSRRVAIGIYISPQARGQGYARESIELLHGYLRETLNCTMIYATVLDNNVPSQRLFSSLGYKQTARLERWHWQGDSYHDLMYYQLWLQ